MTIIFDYKQTEEGKAAALDKVVENYGNILYTNFQLLRINDKTFSIFYHLLRLLPLLSFTLPIFT